MFLCLWRGDSMPELLCKKMHRTTTSLLKVAWTHPREISYHAFYYHQTILFPDNLQHVKETHARDGGYTKAKRDHVGDFYWGEWHDQFQILARSPSLLCGKWDGWGKGETRRPSRLSHKTINYNDLWKEVDRCANIKEVMWEFLMINRMWKGEEEEIKGHS